jgi:hypothetical protein
MSEAVYADENILRVSTQAASDCADASEINRMCIIMIFNMLHVVFRLAYHDRIMRMRIAQRIVR